MNKMKRIFSLVLAFAIMLGTFGSFAPVFAAEEGATADSEVLRKVPEDVIGTEHEDAIRRLVAFGIIGGYPDGTYKPENVVNRAQFSKIIVEALGLRDAVPAATGQGTAFSDVKGDYWAAGYINVASGQGLLKGYPDGTFRPAKEVKYSEALTMLVRALGYKDEFLSGEWPGNYVAKAADRGITSGVKIPTNANEGAQRGFVAQLVNNTLDAEIVTPKKYTGGLTAVEFEDTEITLLKDKLNISKHEDTRIIEDKIINDGLRVEEAKVKFLQETKNVESVRKTYARDDKTESHDFRITGKFNVRPFIGEEVSTYLTDKDEIIYVERENDDRANFDFVSEIKGNNKDELDLVKFDREYKFDKDADVYVFENSNDRYKYYEGKELQEEKDIKDLELPGKVGKFVVRNNRIVFAEIMESTEANPWFVVLKNDKGVVEGINKDTEDFKLDLTKDGTYDGALIFDTEGNELSVNDIEKGNVLYVQAQDYDGDDYVYVVAVQDNKTTGKVGRFREDRVEIDDKFIQVVNHKADGSTIYDSYYSIDTLEDIKQWKESSDWENDFDDANKEEVTIYKDAVGRIAFLSTDVETSSGYKFGVVTRTYADGDRVRIFTTIDGKEGKDQVFKADKESNLINPETIGGDVKSILGQPVKFRLNKDGEISKDEFYVMSADNVLEMRGDFSKDTARLKDLNGEAKNFAVNTNIDIIDAYGLDPKKIDLAKDKAGNLETYDSVIEKSKGEFEKIDIDDFDIAKWEDMKGTKEDPKIKVYVFPRKGKANEAEGMVFVGEVGANTGTDKEAVYVRDRWRDGDDIKVEYMAYGADKTETRIVDGANNIGDIERRSPYVGEIRSNGKIKLEPKAIKDVKNGDKVEDHRNNTTFAFYKGKVKDITGSKITLEGIDEAKDLLISNSAVVYDGGDKKSTSNIKTGDNVFIIIQDEIRVRVVQITDKASGSTPETGKEIVSFVENGKSINSKTIEAGKALSLDVVFKNNTDKNISIAANDVSGQKVDKNGATVTVTGLTSSAFTALKGKTVDLGTITNTINNIGEYTIIVKVKESDTVTHSGSINLKVVAVESEATEAEKVKAAIASLSSAPTKAEVEAIESDYQGLTSNGKALVTNYAKLEVFVKDIAAGALVEGMALGTNKEVADAKVAYDKLGRLGKAEVTPNKIETAETALKDAKKALADKIAEAKTLYETEKGRLDSFNAIEVAEITSEKSTEPKAYSDLVNALNTAIKAGKAYDVDADTVTVALINSEAGKITTASGDVTTAKVVFDALQAVIDTGK